MSGESTFRVGDAVMVKAGVMCPDKPSLSLAGWQGWVTEVDSESGTIGFTWDSMTLRAIPDNYIRECELEGLGWETMGLDIAEVSLAAPRDTPQEAQAVYEEIMRHHAWDYLADLNPGIGQLLGSLGETDTMTVLNAWKDHLENVLRFPFKARREEAFERSPVAVGKISCYFEFPKRNTLFPLQSSQPLNLDLNPQESWEKQSGQLNVGRVRALESSWMRFGSGGKSWRVSCGWHCWQDCWL